jgi:hypothetical protein
LEFEDYKQKADTLASERYKKLANRYHITLPSGEVVNAAHARDNVLDVLEEAGDILTLSGLIFERIIRVGYAHPGVFEGLQLLGQAVEDIFLACYKLDGAFNDEFRKEDVKRDVSREDVGLTVTSVKPRLRELLVAPEADA